MRRITDEQAAAIREAMARKGERSAKVYVGMRYWKPFTEDAVAQIKEDGVTKLVVLPLYPQFSSPRAALRCVCWNRCSRTTSTSAPSWSTW